MFLFYFQSSILSVLTNKAKFIGPQNGSGSGSDLFYITNCIEIDFGDVVQIVWAVAIIVVQLAITNPSWQMTNTHLQDVKFSIKHIILGSVLLTTHFGC